jgi:hypothetical protein
MPAVLVLAAVFGALGILVAPGVLAVLAVLTACAVLILRAELAGVVACLHRLAGIPLDGFA